MTKQQILDQARQLEGRRIGRCLHKSDVEDFLALCASNPGKRVRVYSRDGFVPNSYKYPAPITAVERSPAGEFRVFTTDAKRSHGNGSVQVVQ